MAIVFWIACFFIIYHLFFYGMILQFISIFKKRKVVVLEDYQPSVTMVTAAFNEEKYIEKKLISFQNLNYPKDKINLVIVSDDSSDRTNEIVQNYADKDNSIKLVIQKPRNGKASALNLIEPTINSEIVISSDASSVLDKEAVNMLVRYFADSSIGLVTGKLQYIKVNSKESGEVLYWKYESWLRQCESDLYSIIVASGCLFAIRRHLYKQIHPSSPDDFERTLITLKNGYRAVIEPQAIVYEELTQLSSEEFTRKVRIISSEWFALFRNAILLNPFKFPIITFLIFSHKLIRWLLPFISLGLLLSCLLLHDIMIFKFLLSTQVLIYILAMVELISERKGKSYKLFKLPGYWLAMNLASFVAFIKFLSGKQQKTWNTD
ncbi:MAG: glycosyltransferase family 2 protein [Candidatus Cloacimonetes bacterium]|nr:glycosyltransferase family 2 protein [Candidatus Cloacimonadota bacterium]